MINISVKVRFNETSDLLCGGGGMCFHYSLFTLLMDSPLYVMPFFLSSVLHVLHVRVTLLSYDAIRKS